MKLRWLALACALAVAVQVTAQDRAPKRVELKDLKQKASYSIGMNMGMNLKRGNFDIDVDLLARGIKDGMAGKTALTEQEAEEVMRTFQEQLVSKQRATNKKKGEAYQAANKAKKGVKITKTGLQYKVITQGKGARPGLRDMVKAHYKGTLIDGEQFDSSLGGEPASFAVEGVIPGWTEALQMMNVGSKWELVIPAHLAYGPNGYPPAIGPDSTLVFEVELIDVMKRPNTKRPESLPEGAAEQ